MTKEVVDLARYGILQGIAKGAGCSRAYVRNIVLSIHPGCSPKMARKLVLAARLEGVQTEELDWIFPAISGNAFFLNYRQKGPDA